MTTARGLPPSRLKPCFDVINSEPPTTLDLALDERLVQFMDKKVRDLRYCFGDCCRRRRCRVCVHWLSGHCYNIDSMSFGALTMWDNKTPIECVEGTYHVEGREREKGESFGRN